MKSSSSRFEDSSLPPQLRLIREVRALGELILLFDKEGKLEAMERLARIQSIVDEIMPMFRSNSVPLEPSSSAYERTKDGLLKQCVEQEKMIKMLSNKCSMLRRDLELQTNELEGRRRSVVGMKPLATNEVLASNPLTLDGSSEESGNLRRFQSEISIWDDEKLVASSKPLAAPADPVERTMSREVEPGITFEYTTAENHVVDYPKKQDERTSFLKDLLPLGKFDSIEKLMKDASKWSRRNIFCQAASVLIVSTTGKNAVNIQAVQEGALIQRRISESEWEANEGIVLQAARTGKPKRLFLNEKTGVMNVDIDLIGFKWEEREGRIFIREGDDARSLRSILVASYSLNEIADSLWKSDEGEFDEKVSVLLVLANKFR